MKLNTNLNQLLCVGFLFCFVASLQAQNLPIAFKKQLENFDSTITQEKLYIHTDRTYYKPGDDIWFSIYLLDQQLAASTRSNFVRAELIDPLGNIYKSIFLQCNDSTAIVSGDFYIDDENNGGFFKIRAYTSWMEQLGEVVEKEINVQPVLYSNLLLNLDFDKNSYGAGSSVEATLNVKTLYNDVLVAKKINYTVFLSGKKWISNSLNTDQKGNALLQFQLPKQLDNSDALIVFKIVHEDIPESISRSIPLVLNNIDLQFLPEGGHYIPNMNQKIAFKAIDEFGEPADVEGLILVDGDTLCDFQSYHDGMGSFELQTADYSKNYSAKITNPVGIHRVYPIQIQSLEKTIGLRVLKQTKDSLQVNIFCPQPERIWLTVQMQGAFHYEQAISCKKGNNFHSFSVHTLPIGIAQITVFDKQLTPHAERLAFVNKHKQLHIDIQKNKEKYLPREKVVLNISVKDQDSIPVQGAFSLAVVNEKNISLADDKQANILAQFLLNSDLKAAVHEPNFYFDAEAPKADQALDHLLLTQGWRRFDWTTILKEKKETWLAQLKKVDTQSLIKGVAYVNGIPLTNHQILMHKEESTAQKKSKKEAQAISRTNSKGEFEFRGKELVFPTYLSTQYRGVHTNAYIPAARTGTYKSTLIQSEDGLALAKTYHNGPRESNRSKAYPGGRGSRRNRNGNGRTNVTYGDGYYFAPSTATYVYRPGAVGTNGLRGLIQDNKTDEGIPFANVILLQGEEIKYGTTTDFDGRYQFSDVAEGTYTFKVTYLGYEDFTLDLELKDKRSATVDVNIGEQAVLLTASSVLDKAGRPSIITVTAENYALTDAASVGAAVFSSIDRSSLTSRPTASFELSREKNILELQSNDRTSMVRRLPPVVTYKQKRYASNTYGNRYNLLERPYDWQALADIQFQIKEVKALTAYQARRFYSPKYSSTTTSYRNDFRETIYWNPQLLTDAKGKAKVSFYCSDDISTFRTTIEGVGHQSVGSNKAFFYSQNHVEIKTKVPTRVVQQDSLMLPVVIRNNSNKAIEGNFTVQLNRRLIVDLEQYIHIPADSFVTLYLDFVIDDIERTQVVLALAFIGKDFSERSTHQLEILSQGFPVEYAMSDDTSKKEILFNINNPILGSVNAAFYVSTNPLSDLTASITGIMREPTGCFEQTSAKNYPNILALQYMETTNNIDAEQRLEALRLMEKGYAKLTSYETSEGGFSLYGRVPASTRMSAYGLAQFQDMQAVYNGVSEEMLTRVKNWLLEKEDKHHRFDNSNTTNAYVIYALSKMKEKGIESALNLATKEAIRSKDLYRLALMLLANLNYNNKKEAKFLWELYDNKINKQALGMANAEGTIVHSRGTALNITLVSMGVVALMKMKQHKHPFLDKAMAFIIKQKKFSTYGNTQSTIWALKALSAHQKIFQDKGENGTFVLEVNDQEVKRIAYSAKENRQIHLTDLGKYLIKGENKVTVSCETKRGDIPTYSFEAEWHDQNLGRDSTCEVALSTNLNKSVVELGETVRLTARLRNKKNQNQGSAVALIGIPSGLSLQAWQLKELQDQDQVDFIELMDEYIVLHYKDLEPEEEHVVHLDLKTEFGGTFYAPASSAYLYYYDEQKDWTDGTFIKVLK